MGSGEEKARESCGTRPAPSHSGLAPNFWARVAGLPLVKTTVEFYAASKEKYAVLGTGLDLVELGVNMALASPPVHMVATSFSEKAPGDMLDNMACQCLNTLEKSVPIIHEEPAEIVKHVRAGASTVVHSLQNTTGSLRTSVHRGKDAVTKTVGTGASGAFRRALKTYPGRQAIRGLDSMITWSENMLDRLDGEVIIEKPPSRGAMATIKEVPNEGADMAEEPEVKRPYEMLTMVINKSKLSRSWTSTLKKILVMEPLQAWTRMLKFVKQMIASVAGLDLHRCSSPKKKPKDIEGRRKISPKKRLPKRWAMTGMFDMAKKMLGLKGARELHLHGERICAGESPDKKRKEKRKFEDDTDSEEESLDLVVALENYRSDEDSDYEPSNDQPSTDSMEYQSGDTESDLEEEVTGEDKTGEKYVKLRDSEKQAGSRSKDTNKQDEKQDAVKEGHDEKPPNTDG